MSVLEDALRILFSLAGGGEGGDGDPTAVDILRKYAPCEGCEGVPITMSGPGISGRRYPDLCGRCHGAGFTATSLEVALVRMRKHAELDQAVLDAAERVRATQSLPCRHEEEVLAKAVDARQAYRSAHRTPNG